MSALRSENCSLPWSVRATDIPCRQQSIQGWRSLPLHKGRELVVWSSRCRDGHVEWLRSFRNPILFGAADLITHVRAMVNVGPAMMQV